MSKKRTIEDVENYVFGKIQPQAVELEEAVLGACMLDKEAFLIAASVLKTKDFYVEANQKVWEAMLRLSSKNAPIDLLTVMEEYKDPGYLAELTNRVASATNLEYHARIVKQKSLSRELVYGAQVLLKEAYENDPLEALEAHETYLSSLMDEKSSGVSSSAEVAAAAFKEYVDAYERKGRIKGIEVTGIWDIDYMLNGAVDGDLICFAGRPKTGKSSVAAAITMNFYLKRWPLYYASGEEGKTTSLTRVVSGITRLPADDIEMGKELNNKIWQDAHSEVSNGSVRYYTGPLNLFTIKSHILMHMRMYKTKVFLIDRFELFEEISNCRPGGENDARTRVAQALRIIVNQTGCAIIIFAQCNASVSKESSKRPTIYSVYGQTPLQANCTKILLLYRPEADGVDEFQGVHEGISAKNKMEIFVGAGNSIKYSTVLVEFDGASRIIRGREDFRPEVPQDKNLPF